MSTSSQRVPRPPLSLTALAIPLAVLLAAVSTVLLWASPAAAHAALLETSPARGIVVQNPPEQVSLTFSESVQPVAGQVRIIGPDGTRADTGKPRAVGARLVIETRGGAPRGTYLVSFRVTSADGHPVSGGYSFSVGEPSQPPETPASAASGENGIAVTLLPALRLLGHAGLVMLVGAIGLLALSWPALLARRQPARLAWCGLALITVGALGELVWQGPYLLGVGITELRASDLLDVLDSRYGHAHLARLALALLVAPLLRRLVAGRHGRLDLWLLTGAGMAALLTWPLSGHPVASPAPWLSVSVDAVHLGAVSVWLGGIAVLAGFLLRRRNRDLLAAELPVWLRGWTRVAAITMAALAVAGVTQAVMEVRSFGALTGTPYGVLVLSKVGLLGLILVAAGFARRHVLRLADRSTGQLVSASDAAPAVVSTTAGAADGAGGAKRPLGSGNEAAVPALRRLIVVELTLAAAILAVTAVLTQTTPARTAPDNVAGRQADSYTAKLASSLYTLRVEVDPGRVGNNDLHLYASDQAGKPLTVVEWRVTAALPGKGQGNSSGDGPDSDPEESGPAGREQGPVDGPEGGIAPIEVPVLALTDDHASGQLVLPVSGRWVLRFTLRTSEIDQATVSTTLPVG